MNDSMQSTVVQTNSDFLSYCKNQSAGSLNFNLEDYILDYVVLENI